MGLFATLRHIRRLNDVEDRLAALEREVKGLDGEWTDFHDEVRVMLGKITKRKKILERLENAHEAEVPGEPATEQGEQLSLTASQSQAQREILARRRILPGGR